MLVMMFIDRYSCPKCLNLPLTLPRKFLIFSDLVFRLAFQLTFNILSSHFLKVNDINFWHLKIAFYIFFQKYILKILSLKIIYVLLIYINQLTQQLNLLKIFASTAHLNSYLLTVKLEPLSATKINIMYWISLRYLRWFKICILYDWELLATSTFWLPQHWVKK